MGNYEKQKQQFDEKASKKRRKCCITLTVLFVIILMIALVAVPVYFFIFKIPETIKVCGDIKCGSNGNCNVANGQKICLCDPGYIGQTCEKQITSCSEKPCKNGFCRCSEQGFYCVCKANYTGRFCESVRTPSCSGNPSERCQRKTAPPQAEVGWYALGNGYQYILTEGAKTWNESQRFCQRYGAGLATIGVRHYETRVLLVLELIGTRLVWIGLSDTSGTWTWIDRVPGDKSNTFWISNSRYDDFSDNRCALLGGEDGNDLNSRRFFCVSHYRGLCEKRILINDDKEYE